MHYKMIDPTTPLQLPSQQRPAKVAAESQRRMHFSSFSSSMGTQGFAKPTTFWQGGANFNDEALFE